MFTTVPEDSPAKDGRLETYLRDLRDTVDTVQYTANSLESIADRIMGSAGSKEEQCRAPEPVPNGVMDEICRVHQELIVWLEEIRAQTRRLSEL